MELPVFKQWNSEGLNLGCSCALDGILDEFLAYNKLGLREGRARRQRIQS
jgi:hypothetical protein